MAININLNDVQSVPVVVNSSLTAALNKRYTVVASATFTDPSPVDGKGFIVFVINGTATVGGTGYSTAGTIIYRAYHSGAWSNKVYYDKAYFDTIYQAAGTYLTSANITQTITNGDTTHTPSSDAVYDALAGKLDATSPILLFEGSFSSINLADSTTYFFGTLPSLPPQTTGSLCRFGFDKNRTITKVILTCSQGTNYSNESVSVYIRKDNTTDSTITTSLDLSSVGVNSAKIFSFSTNISVLSASYYEIKIVTPAFATNGIYSRWFIQLYGY